MRAPSLIASVAVASLLACGGARDDEEPRAPVAAPAPAPAPPALRTVVGDGSDASVALAFEGVGGLHRKFFSEPRLVGNLASALGPCLRGEATVRVRWEEEVRVGRITLEVDPAVLVCGIAARGDALDLSALAPVGRALAGYRDAVAGAFDLRVASFRGEVRLPGQPACTLRLGGGFPPDGSRWHPCVELGDRTVCADGGDDGLVEVRLPEAADQSALRACALR